MDDYVNIDDNRKEGIGVIGWLDEEMFMSVIFMKRMNIDGNKVIRWW